MSAVDRTPSWLLPKPCPECGDAGFIVLDGQDIACPCEPYIPQPTEWDSRPASAFWGAYRLLVAAVLVLFVIAMVVIR
jgi:hypothetical protein